MQRLSTSILILASIAVAAVWASPCSPSTVTRLLLDTPVTDFVKATTISLSPVVVKTIDNSGSFINTGVVQVTVRGPTGVTLSATSTTLTTSSGTATFSGITLTNALKGTNFVYFDMTCGGSVYRTEILELTISAGNAASVRYFTQPELSITNYGTFPVAPQLAYYDVNGNVADMLDYSSVWTLTTNDTVMNGIMSGNTFLPTIATGPIVSFDTLRFDMSPGQYEGRVFNLWLVTIGANNGTGSIPFPANLTMKVASCRTDYGLGPGSLGASADNQIVQTSASATNALYLIQGWGGFMSSSAGACRFSGAVIPYSFVDICNVGCLIPGGPGTKGSLSVAIDGIAYQDLGQVTVVGPAVTLAPSSAYTVLYRQQLTYTTIQMTVVDSFGSWLGDTVPQVTMNCSSNSTLAEQKRVRVGYNDPYTGMFRTPAVTPLITRGKANTDLVFNNNLEPDRHVYCCSASGIPTPGCFTIEIREDCTSPPSLFSVTWAGCTGYNANGDLINCLTAAATTLTVTGINFGYAKAKIRVGSRYCDSTIHDPTQPGRQLLGIGCKGSGGNNTLLIIREDAKVYAMWKSKIHFTATPTITSIVGCADFYPSTANCNTSGTSMVQIQGTNFGMSGARVYFYYYDPPGAVPYIQATNVTHIVGSESTKVNATGFPGVGSRFAIGVQTVNGELGLETEVTMSYTATVVVPCPRVNGVQCNGKGVCVSAVGTCTCFSDATNGYWSGAACDACKTSYFGATCTSTCPGGVAAPCSNVGTCSDGLTGTGMCTCQSGYGGTACQTVCPGGLASPCSNHGTCTQNVDPPVCICNADSVNGYWSGSTCSTCNTLYVGSACTLACPTSAATPLSPCSGQGTCINTASGAACQCNTNFCASDCSLNGASCGVCPAGMWGATCANQCPGYSNSGNTVCNGHGTCSQGTAGTGVCFCYSSYAGNACQNQCQSNSSSVACSGAGSCSSATATCTCNFGYSGAGCQLSCPGRDSSAGVCSGHGACSGNANCTCTYGYTAYDCSAICPGGLSSPCSNHGVCNTNQTCTCASGQLTGYWAGAECSTCASGWYSSTCNRTCVKINGNMCNGHGSCTNDVLCSCSANSVDGYWMEPNCTICKPNYWGPSCRSQCPGGACNACSQHGTCSDGLSGTGVCTCFGNLTAGYWIGTKCDTCAASWYGQNCNQQCPFGGLPLTVCSGHGSCSDGLRGNGACTCITDSVLGYWGGTACSQCLTGFYGLNCTLPCPGSDGRGTTCSGHGSCADGFAGTGVCTCQTGYGKSDCSGSCPLTSPSVYCSGNGICLDGATRNGTCSCYQSNNYGFWSNSKCSDCLYGYYGTSCILSCPVALGSVCAGHGTCDYGTNGTGTCSCNSGWSGKSCSRPCDGGASNPCSMNGLCSSSTGRCTCNSSPRTGYWAGRNCSTCNPLYNSSGCTTACPVANGNPNVPCNGVGVCYNGLCTCPTGYCGDKCELSGGDCVNECADGYFGSDCSGVCPGKTGAWCSGNGACSQGLKGTGLCTCYVGYWSKDCSQQCKPNPSNPCSGHGTCSADTGTCTCTNGYASVACDIACPGGVTNICNLRGSCSPADGTCTCNTGYAGLACELVCPGGANNACNSHGTCNVLSGNCTCYSDSSRGYWNGTSCSGCLSGYYGNGTCTKVCVNGYTNGTTCICSTGWSGEDCSKPCPGVGTALGLCSGHGKCLSGNQYTVGVCVCDADYYTTTCAVQCTLSQCQSQPYYLVNGKCDNVTGQCACIANATAGYWTDPSTRCTTCALFWWGTSCTQSCPCLNRGGCDQFTGTCQCFDTDAEGHFDGVACEKCKTGYIGAQCKGKDVIITRQKPCSSIAEVKSTSQFTLLDTTYGLIITGSRPLVICNLTTRLLIGTYEFTGSVISGYIADANNYVFTLGNLDNYTTDKQQKVRIRREMRPTFTIQSQSNIYSVNASYITGASFVVRADEGAETESTGRHMLAQSAVESTGRALQGVWAFTTPTLVKTISISTTEYLSVMSNGVVTRTVGLDVVQQFNYGAFFTQVMAADLSTTLLISPSLLFLGGVGNGTGTFQLIAIQMPLATTAAVQVLTSQLTSKATYCQQNTCTGIANLIVDGTYVVMAMLISTGAGIVRFRYTQLWDSTYTAEANGLLAQYDVSTVINVTAMLLDDLSSAGFVAINLQSPDTTEPTTIYKFDLLDLQVYGSVAFQKVVTNYEIVTALSKDDNQRILFATVPLDLQINVVPLNLYAVTSVYPTIADTAGGTVVTVEGEGFINDGSLNCNFNGTIVSAQYVSSRQALCVAPVGGDERCEGVPLEITVLPNQYTKNNILLRRVSSARITKIYAKTLYSAGVDNAYGNQTGGTVVVLEGFGFQDSPYLACRFASSQETQYAYYADRDYSYSGGTQGVLYNNARFLNATMMECDQPKFNNPTSGSATVEVTLDGTVYSTSGMTYQAVGPAVGLATFRNVSVGSWTLDTGDSFSSGDLVTLPEITVFVVDSASQRLRSLDASARRISVQLTNFSKQVLSNSNFSLCDYPETVQGTPVFHTNGVTATVSMNGVATFDGIYFLRPPAGTYGLTFTDESTGWTFVHTFTITVGPAYRLRICNEPPANLDNNLRQLTDPVKLYVEDISGNQLPAASLSGIRVEAAYLSERTDTEPINSADVTNNVKLGVPVHVTRESIVETRVAELQDDFLKFDGLEMTGLYGVTYHINFTSPSLINVTSRGITVNWCVNRTAQALTDSSTLMYFAKLQTSECFVCPKGGWCDGTTSVIVRDNNLWRPSPGSFLFYDCSVNAGSSDSCVAPMGSCVQGYYGPRCSVCIDGWGHQGDYCYKCSNEGDVVGYMIFLIVITIAFVSLLVYTSLTSQLSETLPVVIKIAINHFQVSSRVNSIIVGLPPVLFNIFDIQLQLSELIRFDIVSSECPPLRLTIYGKFYLVLSIPFGIMLFFAFLLLFLALWRRITGNYVKYEKVVISENGKPPRRDRVMLGVARFMSKLKSAAALHRGNLLRDDLRPQFYTCPQYFSAAAVIILCLVYPSMLQWCVTMWDCDDIVYGDADTYQVVSYLRVDRRIVCTDPSHQTIQFIAIAAAMVYGLFVPFLAVALVWSHWSKYGRVHARHLYAFVTAGYDISTWYWESIVMLRKACIVFIIIFIQDTTLRTYLAMWTMTLALGAHGWFQPYDPRRPSLYYLEGLGITTIVVTLNLALLFQFTYFNEGTAAYNALVIFLVVLNIITLAVFFFIIIYNIGIRIRNFVRRRQRGDAVDPAMEGKEVAQGAVDKSELYLEANGRDSGSNTGSNGTDEFVGVDRHVVQKEGLLGAIRRASRTHLGIAEAKHVKKIDVRTVPQNDNETPFERLQRLETERKKQEARESHVQSQAELEKELEELRDHMLRAQALAAAEEAVIAKYPEVGIMRQQHEAELYRLMDEIRKERGEFAVGGAADILKGNDPAKPSEGNNSNSVTAREPGSDDAFEMNFDDE